MCLVTVLCSGPGAAAGCFSGHEHLLQDAAVEEGAAGEGADRADQQQLFTSQHEAHWAGPQGPDEPSQQSGIHSVTETHPCLVFRGKWSRDLTNFCFLPPDKLHEKLLDEAHLAHSMGTPDLQSSLGQTSGGLRHPEGSRPLPHQAGERLPPAGLENAHDSSVRDRRRSTAPLTISTEWKNGKLSNRCCQGLFLNHFLIMFCCIFMGFLGYFPQFLSRLWL